MPEDDVAVLSLSVGFPCVLVVVGPKALLDYLEAKGSKRRAPGKASTCPRCRRHKRRVSTTGRVGSYCGKCHSKYLRSYMREYRRRRET